MASLRNNVRRRGISASGGSDPKKGDGKVALWGDTAATGSPSLGRLGQSLDPPKLTYVSKEERQKRLEEAAKKAEEDALKRKQEIEKQRQELRETIVSYCVRSYTVSLIIAFRRRRRNKKEGSGISAGLRSVKIWMPPLIRVPVTRVQKRMNCRTVIWRHWIC